MIRHESGFGLRAGLRRSGDLRAGLRSAGLRRLRGEHSAQPAPGRRDGRLAAARPAAVCPDAAGSDDYGLLRAIAVVDDAETAGAIRALLAASRVRATVATGRDGSARVLVFPDEYDRAHRLVGWVL